MLDVLVPDPLFLFLVLLLANNNPMPVLNNADDLKWP